MPNAGVTLKPHRHSPASLAVSEPTIYPKPLKKKKQIHKTVIKYLISVVLFVG